LVVTIILCIFASGIGEKSGFIDALAFISHFTKDAWKTSFGIVRIKKQGEVGNGIPSTKVAMHTPLAWSILICG
jgi:hypothetical protein